MKKRKMYIRMITASLLRRRSRMIIALLAISIGAMILSGLVTIYYDVPRQMGAQFRSYGANMILVSEGDTITQQQVDETRQQIPADKLVGIAAYRYQTVRINDRPVMAAAADLEQVRNTSPFWLVDGEWPAKEGEIMIGKNLAETYNLKVGKRTTCTYAPESETEAENGETEEVVLDNWVDFTVTGILDTGGKEEDYAYMLLSDMEKLTGLPTEYDVCELSVSGNSSELSAIADTIAENVEGIQARLVKRVTESEDTVLSKLQSLVLLVTVVVLALTMICVATTMTAVVAERRKEIGLRKALGASNGSIISEFMGEGVVLGAFGGLLGSFLGFLFAQAVSRNVFNSSITLMPWLVPVTILASVLVTGIACLIPIRSATQIDPALVLKGE
ncbi:MAG: ABC transporter permease [Lachnospiraceae bacterium]|nr:ABC transporter permease [Lachnospiraceae bacterium]